MSVLDELERDWKWMEFSLLYDDDPLMPKLIAVARAAQRLMVSIQRGDSDLGIIYPCCGRQFHLETCKVPVPSPQPFTTENEDLDSLRAALAQLEGA